MTKTLTALAITCSLKPSPAESSSDLLGSQILDALAEHDVAGTLVRAVDHVISPGVEADMGGDDEWPTLRQRVLAADILDQLFAEGAQLGAVRARERNPRALPCQRLGNRRANAAACACHQCIHA